MSPHDFPHSRFGIDEVYFHDNLSYSLLEKLSQRSDLNLDAEDKIIRKHASHDMIFVFYKRVPNPSVIYRFLEFLTQFPDKKEFIRSNTLLNEEELFAAIKAKKYILVTPRMFIGKKSDI